MAAENNEAVAETLIRVVTGQAKNSETSRRFPRDCADIWTWVYEYISEPHEEVGRSGPVCPFVPPALKAGHLEFSVRYDLATADSDRLVDLVLAEMADFDSQTPPLPSNGVQLHSRLVSFPLFERADWEKLDLVYETTLKDGAVKRGLMVGQFHPECAEPAVRNLGFRVSRSPHAMVAMRRMAPHDILFLHKDQRWFGEYFERFGSRYERGVVRDPLMRQLYSAAVAAR